MCEKHDSMAILLHTVANWRFIMIIAVEPIEINNGGGGKKGKCWWLWKQWNQKNLQRAEARWPKIALVL